MTIAVGGYRFIGYYPARFGSATPLPSGVEGFRQTLVTFIEKGQPLRLPEESVVPGIVQPTFQAGLQQLTPQKLLDLKDRGVFGVAEESSDILYYLGIKAMLHSGVFTEARANAFTKSVDTLLRAEKTDAFNRIHDLARLSITPADIQTMKPYFPLASSQSEGLLKDYLEMALVDNAIWSVIAGDRGQLFKPEKADAKIAEETEEFGEHLTRLKGQDASSLAPYLGNLNTPGDFQSCLKTLHHLGHQALSSSDFTLENLLRFAIMKSSGRTEAQYMQLAKPYPELKAQAKAWEKILEAQVFLKQV